MNAIDTSIPDVKILEPKLYHDDRGFFLESYNQMRLNQALEQKIEFVQDNHSKSRRGVLRGLHYQIQHTQGKLLRVIQGQIFDVAVDVRKSSSHFGQWVGVVLSSDNFRQLWVPEGFAHGFLVLSDEAEILYKATDFYSPENERTILWDDSHLAINWPLDGMEVSLSEKDSSGSSFVLAEHFS